MHRGGPSVGGGRMRSAREKMPQSPQWLIRSRRATVLSTARYRNIDRTTGHGARDRGNEATRFGEEPEVRHSQPPFIQSASLACLFPSPSTISNSLVHHETSCSPPLPAPRPRPLAVARPRARAARTEPLLQMLPPALRDPNAVRSPEPAMGAASTASSAMTSSLAPTASTEASAVAIRARPTYEPCLRLSGAPPAPHPLLLH